MDNSNGPATPILGKHGVSKHGVSKHGGQCPGLAKDG
jgi:hypothetical protein